MSNELRAAVRTAIQAGLGVIGVFLVAATNFINGDDPSLVDDISTAGKGLAVVGVGLVAAIVTFVGNKLMEKIGVGKAPVYVENKEAAGGHD